MRLYELGSYVFYAMEYNGNDWLPMPELTGEVIERKGLNRAFRAFGTMTGEPIEVTAKAFFANDAAFETAFAAYRTAVLNSTPLQARRQRDDLSYFDYDSENVRYVLVREMQGGPAVTATTSPVAKVIAPGTLFQNVTTKAVFRFRLLPVQYP